MITKKGLKTTIIGIIAIIGLCVKIYYEKGLSVEDFLILTMGVGFILTKDYDASHTKDTDIPPEDHDQKPPKK